MQALLVKIQWNITTTLHQEVSLIDNYSQMKIKNEKLIFYNGVSLRIQTTLKCRSHTH